MMARASDLGHDDFPAFFEALWSRPPFGWQTRLLEQVASEGWPPTLDLPTGSGKTAALDVALFALALDAFAPTEERTQPRRIALVIDRRVVVDQGYARAVAIAKALRGAREGVLRRVADALRALQDDAEALPVLPAILRGGMPRESEWARTPHQPVLLVSTVDQVGSRLLFRGYGVSDRMKPVHAGLLGRDTLYLLDEVHLSRPFEETLSVVAEHARSERIGTQLPRPLTVVRMSATVGERPADTFALSEAERGEEVLARRLEAEKRALLRTVKTPKDSEKARGAMAKACVAEAKRLGEGSGRVVAVIVNRVATAHETATLARDELGGDWSVHLMTGRMRPLDRAELQAGLLDRIRAGRTRTGERILLVSTQAVEAGADFDFDALVTECASLDALRQRFGRLDRLGELQSTEAVVLAGSREVGERANPDPIYGEALGRTWRWLEGIAAPDEARDGPVVDFGIASLDARLAEMEHEAFEAVLAPRGVAPVLLPGHLERWMQTSPAPSADPDVAPFLHGPDRGAPDVQIVWRADLSAELLNRDALPDVRNMLVAVPPSALEALSVPLWAARGWLEAVRARRTEPTTETTPPDIADVEGVGRGNDADEAAMAAAVRWRGDETTLALAPDHVKPGDTLVVPASYGGIASELGSWDPAAREPVRDRGDEAQLVQRGLPVLRWSAAVLGGWKLPENVAKGPVLDEADDLDERGAEAERNAFATWAQAALAHEGLPGWLRLTITSLQARRPRLLRLGDDEKAWRASVARRGLRASALRALTDLPSFDAGAGAEPTTEDDGGSFTSVAVSLERHLAGVRDYARRFARSLALPDEVASDVALAGWLHDLGKADPRFQIMLHGGDEVAHALADEPLAKSAVPARDRATRERARRRAGYPAGTRHELMTLALVQNVQALRDHAHDWDLVLHLVASHHGYCRPFAPLASDPDPVEVSARLDGMSLSGSSHHHLVRIDSGIADRFWLLSRRYGHWGLAWLEAVLRLADHRESEEEEKSHGD